MQRAETIKLTKIYILFLSCLSVLVVSGCVNDDINGYKEIRIPYTGLQDNKIVIADIQGIPEGISFDRIEAQISGKWWENIATVRGDHYTDYILLTLPQTLPSEQLSPSQKDKEAYGLGYWPATSTDPQAGVAALSDIIAYNGDTSVGRIYLTDWSGEGSSMGKAFIYYHYAEKEFSLSGSTLSFRYEATFKPGWNAYANINTAGLARCTTSIPETFNLHWRFEAW